MNKNKFLVRGSVGLMAIVVVAVLVIGGGAYLVMKKSPEQKVTQVEQSASDIGASFPSLDFSLSSFPDLEVSSLNVAAPQVSTGKIFSAPSFDTDFSFDTPSIDIATPSISTGAFDFKMPSIPSGINIPTIPSGSGSSEPYTGAPTAPPTETSGAPSIDCSMFAMVPSCSYIPAGQGQDACKQCFPNK